MSDLFDVLIPAIILGMLCKGVLEVLLGGKKRRTPEEPSETPGETTLPDYDITEQDGSIKPPQRENPVEKFNRALRKHEQEKLAQQADNVYDESKPQSAKQRIHRDDELVHETKGRIYHDSVPLSQGKSTVKEAPVVHDKGHIYQENKFRGYNNYQPSTITAVDKFTVQPMQQQQPKPKVKLQRAALVQGFIMAQVLDKPRSLKPYGMEENL